MKTTTLWLLLAASTAPLQASAALVPLSDLFGGDTITSGDKIFSNFAFVDGTNGVDETAAGTISVEAVGGGATPGLRFFSGDVVQSLGAPEATDLVISFTVTAPGPLIEGLDLEIAGTTDDSTEFSLQGFADSASGRVDTLITNLDNEPTDSVAFAPVTSLDILAGFSAFSAGGGPGGTLIALDEYTLTVRQTPLPASVWLLLGGLGALVAAHRQKQRV